MTDDQYVTVARVGDLAPGEMTYVEVGDEPVCLINLDGEFYAISDVCTHEEAYLTEGDFDPDELEVECPLHGSCFNVATGDVRILPATRPVASYAVKIEGDEVLIGPRKN
jgi:3-phenylpropionate/trans-cinnamate dioxygenase ferredoxin subunit